jgi:DNA gyrase subunit A
MSEIETPKSHNIPTPISKEMEESYLTYAMSVIMSRALPDVRDGLKPSQRRILVAMHDLNLRPSAKHRKCAKISGDTSGNYHPHGDTVIYPTLVRMGQEWSMRHTLIDPQGNFGSIDGDPPAAMRYTEARLAGPAQEMLEDLDKETVDFEDNFDSTRQEPVVLPSKFPNLLVNGAEGIAVGMATRLLPHNLAEVCDAMIAWMDNRDITVEELMQIMPGPDFPTGGTICGSAGIRDAFATGRGSLMVRGVMHTEELKNGRVQIVVDEIPYGVLLPTIKDRLLDNVQNGTIKGIDDVRDESGRGKLVRLVIVLKKDANVPVVQNQLWKFTPAPELDPRAEHRAGQPRAEDAEPAAAHRAVHPPPDRGDPPADDVPAAQGPPAGARAGGPDSRGCGHRRDHRADQEVAGRGDRAAAPDGEAPAAE